MVRNESSCYRLGIKELLEGIYLIRGFGPHVLGPLVLPLTSTANLREPPKEFA